MLDTYSSERLVQIFKCPRCGKKGFLTRRMVGSSSYFVKWATTVMFRYGPPPGPDLLREYKYTGRSFEYHEHFRRLEYAYIDSKTGEKSIVYLQRREGNNSKIQRAVYQVMSDRRRIRYYVGHYDATKFKEQMQKYREGKINSRPNGRTWCLLSDTLEIRILGDRWIKLDEYYRLMNHR